VGGQVGSTSKDGFHHRTKRIWFSVGGALVFLLVLALAVNAKSPDDDLHFLNDLNPQRSVSRDAPGRYVLIFPSGTGPSVRERLRSRLPNRGYKYKPYVNVSSQLMDEYKALIGDGFVDCWVSPGETQFYDGTVVPANGARVEVQKSDWWRYLRKRLHL
jgi:hypothetical protein